MKHQILTTISLLLFLSGLDAAEVISPDGRIKLSIDTSKMLYSVEREGESLVSPSSFGYGFKNVDVINTTKLKHDSSWSPVWGQNSEVRDLYHGLKLECESDGTQFEVHCRAYNDGVAFRLHVTKSNIELKENMVIRLTSDFPTWSFSHPWGMNCSDLQSASKVKEANTPITFKSGSAYFSFHEAALVDYPPMFLSKQGPSGFKAEFRKNYQLKAPFSSPWRVFTIGEKAADLVTSNLILNLNEPCQIKDSSWIKPGASVWDWRVHGAQYDGFTYGLNTASMQRLIDFAAEKGIPYAMVDAGWYGHEHSKESNPLTCIDEIDVPYLAKYAREKGVGLWLYINDKGLRHWNLETTLSTYRKWGVVGIKHGFLSSPTQEGASFSLKVLKRCAKHRLMYDCHEAVKPSGLRRTWPNFLACEYMHSLVDGPKNPVTTGRQLCIVPFLHNLAGPLDRTPGMFDLDHWQGRKYVLKEIPSTICAQVAQSITIFSGLLVLPDAPEAYRKHEDLFDFYRGIPMTWDETRVLRAEVGKVFVVARRSGESWYIGSVAGEEDQALEIDLSFLGQKGYTARVFSDAKEAHRLTRRTAYDISTRQVKRADKLRWTIKAGGGGCVLLKPDTHPSF